MIQCHFLVLDNYNVCKFFIVTNTKIVFILGKEEKMPTSTFFNLPEDKKNKILKAANKEFERVPIEQVSIKNIVESAEIARGSFYQYFEDKEDLFQYIMSAKMGNMQNKLIEMIEHENGNIINIFINI